MSDSIQKLSDALDNPFRRMRTSGAGLSATGRSTPRPAARWVWLDRIGDGHKIVTVHYL